LKYSVGRRSSRYHMPSFASVGQPRTPEPSHRARRDAVGAEALLVGSRD
jgi:hypothetical protein